MALNKLGVTFLLVMCGAVILGANLESVSAKVCPLICFNAAYMTCPSSADQHLTPTCNCCLASKGCTLFKADGTQICNAT